MRAHLGQCVRVLDGRGWQVLAAAPTGVLTGLDLGAARGQALEIGSRPSPKDVAVLRRLGRLARRADVVHAHGLRAGALAALALGRRRGRARLVVTLHNLPVGSRTTRALGEVLERVVARRADLVLAVSPDLAERARHRGARAVGLAVVPAPAAPPPAGGGGAEEVWGEERRLLTVARLAPQKGLDLLLDTAGILRERVADGTCPPLGWVVAGDGPGWRAARERVRAEDLPVRLVGRREDAPALMAASDLVVLTSLWEGQPLTLQEALRAGAAVVATDVGGTALTARGGALLVAPGARALADAVTGLLSEPAALESARARAAAAAATLPGEADLAAQLTEALRPGTPPHATGPSRCYVGVP